MILQLDWVYPDDPTTWIEVQLTPGVSPGVSYCPEKLFRQPSDGIQSCFLLSYDFGPGWVDLFGEPHPGDKIFLRYRTIFVPSGLASTWTILAATVS